MTNNIFYLIKCRTEYSYIESHGQFTIEPFSFLLLSNSLENWQINVFFDILRLCLLLWTACNNCIEIMLQLLVLRKQKLYCDISKICNRLFVESAVIYCKRCWYLIAEITAIRLQNLKIWVTFQLDYSDPLYTVNDSTKYSETTVGKRTQWKPVVFTVKILAVQGWTKRYNFNSNFQI